MRRQLISFCGFAGWRKYVIPRYYAKSKMFQVPCVVWLFWLFWSIPTFVIVFTTSFSVVVTFIIVAIKAVFHF